jgi:hypothetical protein
VAARSRRRSVAASLLGLQVRNPPGAFMSEVSVVCCQADVSAMCRSLVQRSPTDCVCVSLNVVRCNSNPQHLQ